MGSFWKKITLFTALFASSCVALHESDVGVVDWHKSFIGIPRVDSIATSPKFHRVGGRNTQSVVISATESNTLAALSPVNGSIVWRHIFEPEDPIVSFHKNGWVVTSLSGPGGSVLRIFNTLTGDLLLERQLHQPASGLLAEPASIGCTVAFGNDTLGTGAADLFVLTNGHSLHYFVGRDEKWKWSAEDAGSLVVNSNVLVSNEAIYVVGLASSFASYTLHVTALSPATGEVIASAHIPSSLGDGLNDFIALTSATGEPHLLWLESNSIKHLALAPSLSGKASSYRGSLFRKIHDIGLGSRGMFIGIKIDGTGQALQLENDGVKLVWDFEESAPSDKHSESTYAGGWDKDGLPYIGRLYWSYALKLASAELFSPHLADGKGMITGFSFPFDTNQYGTIAHLTMDAANPSMYQVLGRLVITTSTGTIQLWQQDKLQWTREESLAEVALAEFVELPEHVSGATAVAEGSEGFVQRLSRQIRDAKDLPNYLIHFFKRFATGSYESASSSAAPAKDNGSRDAFGFRQVIVAATSRGKIFGLDSSNGDVLWSKLLGLGSRADSSVKSVKMFLIQAVGDASSGLEESEKANTSGPEVVLVAQRNNERGTEEEVVLYHFNALTGENAKHPTRQLGPLQGQKIASGSVNGAYLLKSPLGKVVVVLDDTFQAHLYPDTPASASIFTSVAPSLFVPLRLSASELGSHRIVGHQFTAAGQEGAVAFSAFPTWSLSLPEGEDIQSVIAPAKGPVASIGKVLGNRTTLYKYLNEHAFIVLTAPHSASPLSQSSATKFKNCGLYLVDGVKGSIIYHATVPSTAGACDIKAVLTENWLVYHYYDDDYHGTGQSKGYRMVSVELYEGKKVDEKIRSSDISAYSEKSLDITAYEQSFVYLYDITAITTTSTKYGITSKDIIVASNNHKIQGLSRRFLDPRRPNRKPTTQEQEELLVQYEPLLPDDQRRVLSHNYEVAQVRNIIAAPALLESTSLVFAYGLDLFLTRVAPSKTFDVLSESFNKTQLVITILALAVAIMFTKPAVRRKKLKEKWYN
ncbi:hypothetical protein VNI00_007107 [Paramarasmius palmivorus]|uniref:ER membrane protein complex subunit 1 n=1 Tax=Paramarasmius palmivorus TaxID=297713 RepID=A0AAW0D6N4_9AGAR